MIVFLIIVYLIMGVFWSIIDCCKVNTDRSARFQIVLAFLDVYLWPAIMVIVGIIILRGEI